MTEPRSLDSSGCRRTLDVGGRRYGYFSLAAAHAHPRLPHTLKILLENLLRHEDGRTVRAEQIRALAAWRGDAADTGDILFHPNRLIMHDTTCVPALVDLAAVRDAVAARGLDPALVNPRLPIDLVIDHSVAVDTFGTADALAGNMRREFERNRERYAFIRWAEGAFRDFRVVPPGAGIIHSVNLEYLSRVVWTTDRGAAASAYPDTPLGTDSHTPMINGLGVLGWGIGGIEAEAIMLGQPVALRLPEVVGFRLDGRLSPGASTSDLVLTIAERLRRAGVVGKFVEFWGPGVASLSVPDRATLANMAPEYGATVCYFPIDERTIAYLRGSGRPERQVALVAAYARAQGLWRSDEAPAPVFSAVLDLDLGTVEPCLAGPHRPQDRVPLAAVPASFSDTLGEGAPVSTAEAKDDDGLADGAVAIAAITSCTTTANPDLVLAAGLLARNAVARGLSTRPWVKTSLAPGSRVVADYLSRAGLQPALDRLGFNIVGFGCTTCIGNSGPLLPAVARAVEEKGLTACAVISGNRNFPGRIHPLVKAAYLASPALVVAYALAGTVRRDLSREPLGRDGDGRPVFLADLWPSPDEVRAAVAAVVSPDLFLDAYARVFDGDAAWQALPRGGSTTFPWDSRSIYLRRPPFLDGPGDGGLPPGDVAGARILALLGDDVTTDDLSSAGAIAPGSPAARHLEARGVVRNDFNVYAAYRGNYEVMVRAALANVRLRNEMTGGVPGPVTRHQPTAEVVPVFEAAERYAREGTPLVIVGGRAFGCGSSRDWAAKGLRLLGVRAVIAEGFERIHRANLIGMGVMPLQFRPGTSRRSLGLDGSERLDLAGIAAAIATSAPVTLGITRADGRRTKILVDLRVETALDGEYLHHGGVLPAVLRQLIAGAKSGAAED